MRDWPRIPTPRRRRAIFLDRDGTINVDTHYTYRVEELEFLPSALHALERLAKLPLDIIVVSNQAGIAKKLYTPEEMSAFNAALRSRVERNRGRIDAFYFCPHLEPKDLPPGIPACQCSKPAPGMLREAAEDFYIDLATSFIVGDKTSDITAGKKVLCSTILVNTGKAGNEEGKLPVRPDYYAVNLYKAAEYIEERLASQQAIPWQRQDRPSHPLIPTRR